MRPHLLRQLSVAIENTPGRLATVSRMLSDRGINIEGLCVIDNVEQGMVRMLVSDPVNARAVLEYAGFPVVEAEVLVIELTDQLGKLAQIAEALGTGGVNIEYAYATVDHVGGPTRMVLKATKPRKAREILAALAP